MVVNIPAATTHRLRRAARIILIGAPGAGKGTQSERLLKRYPELAAISSGDLLRSNVVSRTPLGIMAEARIKAGKLVPDNMMLRLIVGELTKRGWVDGGPVVPYTMSSIATSFALGSDSSGQEDTENSSEQGFYDTNNSNTLMVNIPRNFSYSEAPWASFILDGFPRNAAQAGQIEAIIPFNFVVNIQTPPHVIIDRISNRWVHAPSGRVYNTTFNPPRSPGVDDATGEALTRRADDDPDVWRQRLALFEQASQPLLDYFSDRGVLWTVQGQSSDEISPQLFEEFERRFAV